MIPVYNGTQDPPEVLDEWEEAFGSFSEHGEGSHADTSHPGRRTEVNQELGKSIPVRPEITQIIEWVMTEPIGRWAMGQGGSDYDGEQFPGRGSTDLDHFQLDDPYIGIEIVARLMAVRDLTDEERKVVWAAFEERRNSIKAVSDDTMVNEIAYEDRAIEFLCSGFKAADDIDKPDTHH